jgi:glycosyltransferase involved in cell wall biosynthesis
MRDVLAVRDAFADFAHVESEEMFAGAGGRAAPFLTIAIPTHRRPDLLAEAVRSALGQDFNRLFEVVVVDDDPHSTGHAGLLEDVPEIAAANFRYLRNRANLGDAGNHSRCMDAARGEWLTILHDDDLLDPGFAREMFALLEANPGIDGLVCRKRISDRRDTPVREPVLRKCARLVSQGVLLRRSRIRAIPLRKLFWACIPGNVVGFICRTKDARSLGGLYSEDYPSADYFFYARFAERYRLCQLQKPLATIRVRDNASMRVQTQLDAFSRAYEMQTALAGKAVPQSWRKLSSRLISRHLALTSWAWRTGLSREEVGASLGMRIPKDRPLLVYALRLLCRGF